MTITFGRCTVLAEPQNISMSGDVLSFRSQIVVTTLAGFQAAVGQLRGMVGNRDENAFPLTCATDPSLDGFYTDVEVDITPTLAQNLYTLPVAAIRCRRVGSSVLPRIEAVAQSFVRTNSHALSPGSAFLTAIPSAVAGSPLDSDIAAIFTGTPIAPGITPETGVITQYTAAPQATIKSGRYSLPVTPADRYDGSAVIEQSYDNGSTWTRIVGNQIVYPYIGGSSTYQRWRIGNGLIRIAPVQDATAGYSHRVSTFNGSTWEDTDIMFVDGLTDLEPDAGLPIIVQNSPIKCTISVTFGDIVIMFTVTRGIRLVTVTFASSGTTYKWGARSAAVDAATAITGGLRRTNNDANGNRWVFLVPATATSDLVNGYHYYTTATTTGTVGIGIEHNGTTATGQDVATAIRDAFYLPALVDERVTIR